MFYRCFLTCAKPCKNACKIHFWGKKMDSAAEGRALAIFGRLRSSLFASRIRFWHPFCTRRKAEVVAICVGICLGSTPEGGFCAQARVSGVLFCFRIFFGNAEVVINDQNQARFAYCFMHLFLSVYQYLRGFFCFFCGGQNILPRWLLCGLPARLAGRLAGSSSSSSFLLWLGHRAYWVRLGIQIPSLFW